MTAELNYRQSFLIAFVLHCVIACLLLVELSSSSPVLTNELKNEPGETLAVDTSTVKPPEIVKAINIDSRVVEQEVNRIKQERAQQLKAENLRKQAVLKQLEQARLQRIKEQKQLTQLKEEAEKLAIVRKKQIMREQTKLKQLSLQKQQEAKRLDELKQQQKALQKKQKEAEKLAALQKKQQQENEAKAKAEQDALAKKQDLEHATKLKAEQAAQRAKMMGEVDKYKALIINAIGQRWILPEHVDNSLSSQFRIHLAPGGAVLDVSLIRSSGDSILDRSAQAAIYKASPLPVPEEASMFNLFRDISLTVRPQNVRG